ncbi:MAG: hypothetical protein IJQ75_02230, partial [Synergistaceae bacterium]|nr:hypothetical protein [Synergistaceae bacterium]
MIFPHMESYSEKMKPNCLFLSWTILKPLCCVDVALCGVVVVVTVFLLRMLLISKSLSTKRAMSWDLLPFTCLLRVPSWPPISRIVDTETFSNRAVTASRNKQEVMTE